MTYIEEQLEHIKQNERKILDSGERRQFDSGAVRDIQEGKGRCDLLPLGVVARYFELLPPRDITSRACIFNNKDMSDILFNIHNFLYTRNVDEIYKAIATFIKGTYGRDAFAIMELSKHYEEGAKKYSDRNWEKGIPLHCYVDSGIRHLMKFYDDWTDEPHDRAFMWNMFGLLWTYYHKPELDDLPKYDVQTNFTSEDFKDVKDISEMNSERMDLLE